MSFKFESSYDGLISRADLKKLFWRSIPYEHSWNYERMGHIALCGPLCRSFASCIRRMRT